MNGSNAIEIPYLTPKGPKFGRRLRFVLHEKKEIISFHLRLHRIWQRFIATGNPFSSPGTV